MLLIYKIFTINTSPIITFILSENKKIISHEGIITIKLGLGVIFLTLGWKINLKIKIN